MLGDPPEQRARGVVDVDETFPLAVDLVSRVRILLRVGHEDARTDRLYPERRVTRRQVRVLERTGVRREVEARVEHVNTTVLKARGIEPIARRCRRQPQPRISR